MKATLIAFRKSVEELEQQIACLDLQWKIVNHPPSAAASLIEADVALLAAKIGSGVFRKQFEYNSNVVTLYGLFERYVEGLAVAFLRQLNGIVPSYSNLHKNLRANHLELTSTLLSKPDLQKFRNVYTSVDLVANLNSCLSNKEGYRLNVEAFTYHTANFRSDVVDNFFSRVGITNISHAVKANSSFCKYLMQISPDRLAPNFSGDIFWELNDLAERRNEVAHGSPGEILSNPVSLEYLIFVKEYASALAEVVIAESLVYEVQYRGRELGLPIAVHNNNIVCLRLEKVSVAVGNRIFARTSQANFPLLEGEVQDIQVNKISRAQLTCQNPVDVALRVNFKAKDSYTYFLLEPVATPWSLEDELL